MNKFTIADIERNQKMIDEWKTETKIHNECAVMMFTIDSNSKIRILRSQGMSNDFLIWILENTIQTLKQQQ